MSSWIDCQHGDDHVTDALREENDALRAQRDAVLALLDAQDARDRHHVGTGYHKDDGHRPCETFARQALARRIRVALGVTE